MKNETLPRTHDAPDLGALAAAIQAAVAAWPEGVRCAFCSTCPPEKAAVLVSPTTGLAFVVPVCTFCASHPAALHQRSITWEN